MQTRAIMTWGAAAVLSAAALAGAQPAKDPAGRRPHAMGRLERVLDLTEEQKAAFRSALEQQQPQRQALHEQMRESRTKLRELLSGASPDPAAVGALVIQEQKLREQVKSQREQASRQLRALLTPEQQAKFDVLQSLREERGMGPGRGGRPGFGRGHRGRAPAGPDADPGTRN